jgi:hypothetical protein
LVAWLPDFQVPTTLPGARASKSPEDLLQEQIRKVDLESCAIIEQPVLPDLSRSLSLSVAPTKTQLF